MAEPNKEKLEQEKNPQDVETEQKDTPEETTDDDFINSLLNPDGDDLDEQLDEEEKKRQEEEQRRKNKDAEEARKRREAEAKAKQEAEEKAKQEEEKKAKEEADLKRQEEERKAKEEEDKKKRSANESRLGEQLVAFKEKHPDVDLAQLDKDTHFKKYIDGKLLGKKDFNELYDEYVEFRAGVSNTTRDIVEKNYLKSKSGSGTSLTGGGEDGGSDIYSVEELKRLAEKLPYMSPREAAKIEKKYERSMAYHEKN